MRAWEVQEPGPHVWKNAPAGGKAQPKGVHVQGAGLGRSVSQEGPSRGSCNGLGFH